MLKLLKAKACQAAVGATLGILAVGAFEVKDAMGALTIHCAGGYGTAYHSSSKEVRCRKELTCPNGTWGGTANDNPVCKFEVAMEPRCGTGSDTFRLWVQGEADKCRNHQPVTCMRGEVTGTSTSGFACSYVAARCPNSASRSEWSASQKRLTCYTSTSTQQWVPAVCPYGSGGKIVVANGQDYCCITGTGQQRGCAANKMAVPVECGSGTTGQLSNGNLAGIGGSNNVDTCQSNNSNQTESTIAPVAVDNNG